MRFTHAFVVTATVLLSASAAVAFGAQAPADPCSEITAAQVSTALGETVAAGQKSNSVTCAWIADKPTHQVVSLMELATRRLEHAEEPSDGGGYEEPCERRRR